MIDEPNPSKTEAPKPGRATAPAPTLKTPREWALELGHGPKQVGRNQWFGTCAEHGMSGVYGSPEYQVARTLHGWDDHDYESQDKPLKLTRADFEAALKATHPEDELEIETDGPRKGEPKRDAYGNPIIKTHAGNPVPHPAALSPFKGMRGRLRLGEQPKKPEEASK